MSSAKVQAAAPASPAAPRVNNNNTDGGVKPQHQQQQQQHTRGPMQQQQWQRNNNNNNNNRRMRPPRRQLNNNNSESRGEGINNGGMEKTSTVLESKALRADNKSFYFDKGTNQRGEFVRISEVRPSSRFRASITVPVEHLKAFCDQLAELLEHKATIVDVGGEGGGVANGDVAEHPSAPVTPASAAPKSPAKSAEAAAAPAAATTTPTKKLGEVKEGGSAKKMSELFEQQK